MNLTIAGRAAMTHSTDLSSDHTPRTAALLLGCGMAWYGMVWYGMVWYTADGKQLPHVCLEMGLEHHHQ